METRAKKQKIVDEAEQQMDPLRSVLKEHLLQELMFQHFIGNEVKQLFEVSPLWNEIASKSKKCGEQLQLKIRSDDDADKLTVINANGRKYAMLKLEADKEYREFVESFPLVLDIVTGIGWSLKELKVLCPMRLDVFAHMLSSLRNLETLSFESIRITEEKLAPLQLPKLKHLTGDNLQPQVLEVFRDVTTLKVFDFVFDGKNVDIRLLEDFILRQEKLIKFRILFCSQESQHSFFKNQNRLKEVKFQLDSITMKASTIHPNSTVEFFKQQKNLKSVDFISNRPHFNGTPEGHYELVRTILTLPKLETLSIFIESLTVNGNLINLGEIQSAVKFLSLGTYEHEITIRGELLEMFPNLQEILPRACNLRLIDVHCESLPLVKYAGSSVVYEPPIEFDQTVIEAKIEEFITRTHYFKRLVIGRVEWLAMDFKLSLAFWEKFLRHQVPYISHLTIFHPGNLANLVTLFKNAQRCSRVIVKTDIIGVNSVGNIELPQWMELELRG
jgi:hypothetical protein